MFEVDFPVTGTSNAFGGAYNMDDRLFRSWKLFGRACDVSILFVKLQSFTSIDLVDGPHF